MGGAVSTQYIDREKLLNITDYDMIGNQLETILKREYDDDSKFWDDIKNSKDYISKRLDNLVDNDIKSRAEENFEHEKEDLDDEIKSRIKNVNDYKKYISTFHKIYFSENMRSFYAKIANNPEGNRGETYDNLARFFILFYKDAMKISYVTEKLSE